jgi:bifunctional UDP-N-acetylglucosamine pyrophosphorylase/glucosamine-1-phosphate N-acetyltransferase
VVEDNVELGNYAEVKASRIGSGSKLHHFSYVGDAEIGQRVNIGAGTITCNYDGQRKHRTVVGDDSFIGSDTMLVAPVEIGEGARTGAGCVVTRDVPPGEVWAGVPARPLRQQPAPDTAGGQASREGIQDE